MSEDFRDTPLVRTAVSRNAGGVLHYIFASWKNIVASINDGHVRSNTKIQPQVVMKDANNPPAKRKKPVPMAMQRAKDETAIPTTSFIVEAARADAIPILSEKAALPLERRCLKIRLTDRECGQNSRQCASPRLQGKNKGRMPCPSTQTKIRWKLGS